MSKRRAVRRPILVGTLSLLLMAAMGATASAQPPSNDDRGAATVIGALPFLDSLDTSEATPQVDDPECFSGPGNPTVWYSFTPGVSGRYGASTVGSGYDTTLLVGTPSNGDLDVIDCVDDTIDVQTTIIWQAQAGQTYLIMVGACCGNSGGQLEFSLRQNPPRPRVQVSIAPDGTVGKRGAAIVHGRVDCSNVGGAGERSINVRVSQRAGRFIIRGGDGSTLRCDRSWQARVRGNIGRFAPGDASVRVGAVVCGIWACRSDEAKRTVELE